MKNIFYLLVILVSILLPSCDGKQCINPRNKVLGKSTEQLLGYAKNKSWWVYMKENSNLKDSVYMANFRQRIEHLREGETCDDREVIDFELMGQGILCNKVAVRIEALSATDLATYRDDNASFSLFNFILYKNKDDKYESNNWIDYEVLPTFSVLGVEYDDVIKVYQKGFDVNGVAEMQQKQIRYFAPKIGLIRLENIADTHFPNNSIYNLVKYDIK